MKRRSFLQQSCHACMLVAAGLILPALEGCGPATYQVLQAEVVDDVITVPADSFGKGSLVVVRPRGKYYSVAVRKKDDHTYSALLLKCTHQDNQLTATGSGYTCSLHGSAFNADGQVVKGPAERPLVAFPVTLDNNNHLLIHTKA